MPNRQTGSLTAREQEIAQLVARGLCNKLIARELNLSVGTVKIHLIRIYRKLGITKRTKLAVLIVSQQQEAA